MLLPRWPSICQSRRCRGPRSDPWIGKIPWRRTWQPTPVFLPGDSQGHRSLGGYSLWGCKDSHMTERLTLSSSSLFWVNGLFDHCMESKGLDIVNRLWAGWGGNGILPSSLALLPEASIPSFQFSSVAESCLILCNPMDCSTPGLPVHHQHPDFTQTHAHWAGDTIQPSHPLSSPSPPAFNLSQHRGLFKWYTLAPLEHVGSIQDFCKARKRPGRQRLSCYHCIFMEPWDAVLGTTAAMLPVTRRVSWMRIFNPPATRKMTSSTPKINTQPRNRNQMVAAPRISLGSSFLFLLFCFPSEVDALCPSWKFVCTAGSRIGLGSASFSGQVERFRSPDSAVGVETELYGSFEDTSGTNEWTFMCFLTPLQAVAWKQFLDFLPPPITSSV